MLSPDTVIVRSSRPFTAPAQDELVMLDPEPGRYFGLDGVGRRVWELLEQPRSVSDLCTALTGEFDVDRDKCQQDVLPFLDKLLDAKLLDTVP